MMMTLLKNVLGQEDKNRQVFKYITYRRWQRAVKRVKYAERGKDLTSKALEKWRFKEPDYNFLWELELARDTAYLEACEKEADGIRAHLSDADFEALDSIYGTAIVKARRIKALIIAAVLAVIFVPIGLILGILPIDNFGMFMLFSLPPAVVVSNYVVSGFKKFK